MATALNVVGEVIATILLVGVIAFFIAAGGEVFMQWKKSRRERRIARIEAELDRQAAELRGTILSLAEQLGANAHEARKALIRESYRATGQAPDKP